jgi:hypothetical protein
VGDAFADAQKKCQALAYRKVGGEGVNGHAFHVLHHQKGVPVGRMAGIEHVNDGRMLQRCQQLPLAQKTVAPQGAMSAGVQKLDGDALFELAIGALGEVDAPHAAAPDLVKDAVRADHGAGRESAGLQAGLFPTGGHASISRRNHAWATRSSRRTT